MTGSEYRSKILNTPLKYPSNGLTYCNQFATDVMKNCGAAFPTDANGGYVNCATILSKLTGNAFSYWRSVTFSEAMTRANNGQPTVAITSDHIAVVTPTHAVPSSANGLYVSCSGGAGVNFYDNTITYAWSASRINEIKYYAYCI